jgi:hypothetical protein
VVSTYGLEKRRAGKPIFDIAQKRNDQPAHDKDTDRNDTRKWEGQISSGELIIL